MSRIKDTFNQTFAEGGKGRQITFWVCIALAAILIVSAFVAIAIKLDKLETFEEIPTSAYARGALDDTTGKIDADEADYGAIHTEGFYTVSGLKCLLSEDASISYQINWYDQNKNFISVSNFTSDYDSATDGRVPEDAEYCKIEIHPNDDKDGDVSSLEVSKYAKMLTVRVDKKK